MYIKEIIIDGFKSYAQRTVISGFDPQFNAITGLNGSGKSNILDSICFVLGITNLSHVRAHNLQVTMQVDGQLLPITSRKRNGYGPTDRRANPRTELRFAPNKT